MLVKRLAFITFAGCQNMPDFTAKYKVFVDDNSHYMDDSERYELGEFSLLEEAIEASKKLVDEYLTSAYQPGMNAKDLFESYTSFGEDPFIVSSSTDGLKADFSAWDYAKKRCEAICSKKQ